MEIRNALILLICGIAVGFIIGFAVHDYKSQRVSNPPGSKLSTKYNNECDEPLNPKFKIVYSEKYKMYSCKVKYYNEWVGFYVYNNIDAVNYPTEINKDNSFKDSCQAKSEARKMEEIEFFDETFK